MRLQNVRVGRIRLSGKRGDKHRIENTVLRFLESEMRVAWVISEPGDYTSIETMRSAFCRALKS